MRLGAVILIVLLQLVQFAAAFGSPKAGACCCRGTTCPMKMHCAKSSCEMRQRPAALTVVRAIAPAIVVTALSDVREAAAVVPVAMALDGFMRPPDRPPRLSRMI